MILDAALPPVPPSAAPAIARAAEDLGFGAIWTSETIHDPFLPAALIAEHTRRIQIGTAVAIAFARSPATMAYTAWDLAQFSAGRFILGLGTQVKGHIERRYGMPWPASVTGKLREQIAAIRAFWHTWQTGEPLVFRGEYYRLSLMTPFFNPGSIEHPEIPIYIAGVNAGLAKLAGEVADGFHIHPFHSPAYLFDVLLPAFGEGIARAGRKPQDLRLSATVFAGTSPEEKDFIRAQIAFYASTPSYRTVMAQHGWQEVAEQLSRLAARGRWGEMPGLISDEMLATYAVLVDPDELPNALAERYRGHVSRVTLYAPFTPGERDAFWQLLLKRMG